MKDKTVLEKIGISDKIMRDWKERGLKISYPMRGRKKFFRSDDGTIFVEGADKFAPPLTKKETNLYIKNPEKFKEDFWKNAIFFRRFVNFIYKYQKGVEKLENEDRVVALLSLIYLFHRAMDYHYFHWDRYLVYEDYPSTPVGYWLKKLKDLYFKVKKEKVLKSCPPEEFLKIISGDKKILNEFKKKLDRKELKELKMALKAIKIFEEVQQGEINFFLDFKKREHLFMRTVMPMWGKFKKEIKEHSEVVRNGRILEIKKIIDLHPLVGTRKLFSIAPRYFSKEIFSQFKKEIKRWL